VDISWKEIIRGKGKDIAVGLDDLFGEHFSVFGRSYQVSEYHNVFVPAHGRAPVSP
jgi:hypothetical protein